MLDNTSTTPATPKPADTIDAGVKNPADKALPEAVQSILLQTWTCCRAALQKGDKFSWTSYLGIAAAVLSAVAGTAVFATLQADAGTPAKVFVGTVAIATAVIAAVQAAFAAQMKSLAATQKELHELHHRIARAVEAYGETPLTDEDAKGWNDEFDKIEGAASLVGHRQYKRAELEIRKEMRDLLEKCHLIVPKSWLNA